MGIMRRHQVRFMQRSLKIVPQPVRRQVEDALREAIVTGRFLPGDHLPDRVLCEAFGTSRSVVREAVRLLEAEGLVVGDQLPYSGKRLNATMNRHAEADGRPYLGVEIRQDEIADTAGQARWAERLARICNTVAPCWRSDCR